MINVKSINKNITLSYIPMGKLKTTSVGIYIHRPLCEENASKNALIAKILRQGSAEYPSMEAISKKLDDLYGATLTASVSKSGEDQILVFEAECISDKYALGKEKLLNEVIRLLFGIIFNPKTENGCFAADIFEQEKKNLIDIIRSAINDKRGYANDRMCEILCEGTAYAVDRFGSEKSAQKIECAELYEYYKSIICSSKIDIYVTGDADIEAAEAAISECIGDMIFTEAQIPQTEILCMDGAELKTVTERMDVTQGKLSMGFTTGIKPQDDAYWGLLVANCVFGGGAHSKLFNNVREKLSLAYYAGSRLHKYKGIIAVNAGVEFDNFTKAYDEVLIQLEAVKRGEISEQEIIASKMALVSSYNSYYDDQHYMQAFYLNEKVAGTNHDIEYCVRKVNEVTLKDIVNAASQIELKCAYFLAGKECEA